MGKEKFEEKSNNFIENRLPNRRSYTRNAVVNAMKASIKFGIECREGQADSIVALLKERKKYWQDKARSGLVNGEPVEEVEIYTEMYGVYIEVVDDIREFFKGKI